MQLDDYKGMHVISLVALHYANTRVWNVPIPLHQNFAELSLRVYIKRQLANGAMRYGVCFPRLYFPKPALTWVARSWYKENYHTIPMHHAYTQQKQEQHVSYAIQNGDWHHIRIQSNKQAYLPDTDSLDEFTNKHYFGYSKLNNSLLTEYPIARKNWHVSRVNNYELILSFAGLFGPEYAFLDQLKPISVSHTLGSEVHVYPKRILSV
jgi:uncharacterized protein YqjF (DUF2071 family)